MRQEKRCFQERLVADAWAVPRVYLSGTRAMFAGYGMALTPHRLSVATLVIALDTPFRLERLDGGESSVGRVATIPPDALHHLRSEGRMVFVYLDALSDDHAALSRADPADVVRAVEGMLAKDSDLANHDMALFGAALMERIGLPLRPAPDPRILAVARAMDAAPQTFRSITVAARTAGLSPSRFQHLLRDATGTTFRRYRLWRRMALVARALADGENLTNAALDAGFASSAHLSAAFRAMFGIKPSDLVALNTRFITDCPADQAASIG